MKKLAQDSPFPRTLLVQLLEHLNIITSAPATLTKLKDPYFMPCMLRRSRELIDPGRENPEPLKLHFTCGFTPMGVFPALVTKLFSQIKELKWTILTEDNKIFKNRVKFRVERDIVYLMSHLHYFEIAILQKSCNPVQTASLCHNVRKVFEDALEEVTDTMNYNFLGGHEYAFWCNECAGAEKHLAVFSEVTSDFMVCRRDEEVTGNFNARQTVWFERASESKDSVLHACRFKKMVKSKHRVCKVFVVAIKACT